jgi:hypothetical protein
MQRAFSPQPALPVSWASVLESVQQALAAAEAEAGKREEVAASLRLPSEGLSDREAAWKEWRNRLDERSHAWNKAMEQAEKEAGEGDQALQAGEEELRQWLRAAEAAARRLVNWVASGV